MTPPAVYNDINSQLWIEKFVSEIFVHASKITNGIIYVPPAVKRLQSTSKSITMNKIIKKRDKYM